MKSKGKRFLFQCYKIDKEGNGSIATISYKIKSFDSARFLAISLSDLVDNLAEGTHKIKVKDYDC